jgi:hypothetical protein
MTYQRESDIQNLSSAGTCTSFTPPNELIHTEIQVRSQLHEFFSTTDNLFEIPEGYGDFAIQSSDNGICYFPSQVLSHVSSVFHDMLAVATPDEGRIFVQIDESLQDLENFLTHIDPNTY